MKNRMIYMIGCILVFINTSCVKELDQEPITSKGAENFYSNESEIETAIIGVYAALQKGGLFGLDLIAAGEVSSDNTYEEVPANDGGRFGQLDEFTTNPSNDLVKDIWIDAYQAIQRSNIVLNRIQDITYKDDGIKQVRMGEMYFIRGLLYFYLVRLYGEVPLVVKETKNPNDYFGQGKSRVEDVYNQIESDLDKSLQLLPKVNTSGRPNKYAVYTLLGQVYLTKKQYPQAYEVLKAIESSGEYQLEPIDKIFGLENENNAEVIFAIEFTSGLNGNSEGSRAFSQFAPAGSVSNAKGHNLVTKELYDVYEDIDLRKTNYFLISSDDVPYTSKFSAEGSSKGKDGGSDFIVLRYSDVVLMLAEVLNELGNTSEALVELNKIRSRAGLPDLGSGLSIEDLRLAIAKERRLELINEGYRWFDLKRTGLAVSTMNNWFEANGINIIVTEHDLLLPIPQSQVDTDPALTQNIGY